MAGSYYLRRLVSSPYDHTDLRDAKVRLFLFLAASLILVITLALIILFEAGGPQNRGLLSSAIGIVLIFLIVALGLQVSTKAFAGPFMLGTNALMVALLWCATLLGPTSQGSILVLLAGVLPAVGFITSPLSPQAVTFVVIEVLIFVVGLACVMVVTTTDTVQPKPLADAEAWALNLVSIFFLLAGTWSLAIQERARTKRSTIVMTSQQILEERMAYALDQVRLPLNNLVALSRSSSQHPPHPTVTVAATLLQQAVDDVQTIMGFNVSYINYQPYIVRQVVRNATKEVERFFAASSAEGAGGSIRTEDQDAVRQSGRLMPKWRRQFSVHIDSLVPTAAIGDARRLTEVLLECMWSSVKRAHTFVFVHVLLKQGPALEILVGDDGKLLDPQRRLEITNDELSLEKHNRDSALVGKKGMHRAAQLIRLMLGDVEVRTVKGSPLVHHHSPFVDALAEYNCFRLRVPIHPPRLPEKVREWERSELGAERANSRARTGLMPAPDYDHISAAIVRDDEKAFEYSNSRQNRRTGGFSSSEDDESADGDGTIEMDDVLKGQHEGGNPVLNRMAKEAKRRKRGGGRGGGGGLSYEPPSLTTSTAGAFSTNGGRSRSNPLGGGAPAQRKRRGDIGGGAADESFVKEVAPARRADIRKHLGEIVKHEFALQPDADASADDAGGDFEEASPPIRQPLLGTVPTPSTIARVTPVNKYTDRSARADELPQRAQETHGSHSGSDYHPQSPPNPFLQQAEPAQYDHKSGGSFLVPVESPRRPGEYVLASLKETPDLGNRSSSGTARQQYQPQPFELRYDRGATLLDESAGAASPYVAGSWWPPNSENAKGKKYPSHANI